MKMMIGFLAFRQRSIAFYAPTVTEPFAHVTTTTAPQARIASDSSP